MIDPLAPQLRRLRRPGFANASELAARHGALGVYVRNAVLDDEDGGGELHGYFATDDTLLAAAWFGVRGNLVALGDGDAAVDGFAAALSTIASPWRIALAPKRLVAALQRRESRPAIVQRTQVYYECRADDLASRAEPAHAVRIAERADVDALCEAALALNEADLHVPRERVHRGWLEKSVRRRLREGRTWVIGPVGHPTAKLDVGSRGRAGVVLEGVFTVAEERGRGLATALVLGVARSLIEEHGVVCLHVDAENAAARRAYARAGMRVAGECGLLLRDP
ncbi:MAG: GNAT family N-acetyltransferase [Planctomycetes bacterium]|nr:GNAT family N-acetyltransferase [Planctomycetota bacterium]